MSRPHLAHLSSAGPSAPPFVRATSSRVSDADAADDRFVPGHFEPHVSRARSSGAVLKSSSAAATRARVPPPPPPPGVPPPGVPAHARRQSATAAPDGEPAPTCIICYDEFDRRRAPHRIPCGCQDAHFENHAYVHYGCIRAWAAQKSSCPLCRAPLTVQCNPFVAPAGVELTDFVTRPLPIECGVVQCFVRVRVGMGAPVYDLFLEGPPPQRVHLLTASWQLERGLRSSYVVSLPADATRASARPVARVISNFLGTRWTVLAEEAEKEEAQEEHHAAAAAPAPRAGLGAHEPSLRGSRVASSFGAPRPAAPAAGAAAADASCATATSGGAGEPCAAGELAGRAEEGCASRWRRRGAPRPAQSRSRAARAELVAVGYRANRFCLDSGPRSMSLAAPAVTEDGTYEADELPREGGGALAAALPCARTGTRAPAHVTSFKNRAPVWDDRYEAYVLNFLGRVRVASVKNFQVVQTDNVANETLLQFGRVSSTVFSMDVQWPFSVVQAFGVCLTSIATKLGVK
ncbi:hypothetical protein KFE25_005794 [Diacronema lutheri]|uniref:RING-type domain-containing protein n=2 Tax=Diacronema lutheri TaxID=2081491 RepID=A0A8J5X0N6_DIALT|nr:hypothetical protein KFE25_005794 [Diacronema lutheri]